MRYRCVSCKNPLDLPTEGVGVINCQLCRYRYEYAPNRLKYGFDQLLLRHFGKKYLLNKVLNNNAYIAYHFLKNGSLSLPERQDVINFKKFILSHIASGRLLDVGCGLLEVPGYLDFEEKNKFDIFGLDPIDAETFKGMRIVGCSEFMPFEDNQFDVLIFATSLDHVCSIEFTIQEAYRVLCNGGKVLVWMSDVQKSLRTKLYGWVVSKIKSVVKGYETDRFIIYPNGVVLYRPKGAVDAFHAFIETPKTVVSLMEKSNFRHIETVYNSKFEVFLCFEKR